MTARPPRDLRDEAKHAFARRLRRAECNIPDALAGELLVILDGIHIGLVDTSTPANPDTVIRPPGTGRAVTELPPDNPYRAARAAMKGTQQ